MAKRRPVTNGRSGIGPVLRVRFHLQGCEDGLLGNLVFEEFARVGQSTALANQADRFWFVDSTSNLLRVSAIARPHPADKCMDGNSPLDWRL